MANVGAEVSVDRLGEIAEFKRFAEPRMPNDVRIIVQKRRYGVRARRERERLGALGTTPKGPGRCDHVQHVGDRAGPRDRLSGVDRALHVSVVVLRRRRAGDCTGQQGGRNDHGPEHGGHTPTRGGGIGRERLLDAAQLGAGPRTDRGGRRAGERGGGRCAVPDHRSTGLPVVAQHHDRSTRSPRSELFHRPGRHAHYFWDGFDGPDVSDRRSLRDASRNVVTWDDLAWLQELSPLPLVLKGVMTGEDANRAVEHGAPAVIVSNHGGHALQQSLATADALPEVVEAVDDRVEVLVDGGIRSGGDVLRALALGARAVLIGRPVLWGLTLGGAAGATRVLGLLREELEVLMAMVGARNLDEIDATTVCRRR